MEGWTLCLQVTLCKAEPRAHPCSARGTQTTSCSRLRTTHLRIWKENSNTFLPVLELLNLKDRTDSCLYSFFPPSTSSSSLGSSQHPATYSIHFLGNFHPWLPVKQPQATGTTRIWKRKDLRFHSRSYVCIHSVLEKDHIPCAFSAEQKLEVNRWNSHHRTTPVVSLRLNTHTSCPSLSKAET